MASLVPCFLIAEIRCTFRQCSRQYKQSTYRQFSSASQKQFRASSVVQAPRPKSSPARKTPLARSQNPKTSERESQLTSSTSSSTIARSQDSKELIPQGQDGRAVGTGRVADVPMKIIPKADINQNLRLSPKERLHIEILTRRPPPIAKQVKPYKERLLIYHHGNLAENALVFLKVLGLLCMGVVTVIIVPAHYMAGSSLWLCGSLLLGGFFPSIFFHQMLKPLVTRIQLRLPPSANASPEAAMKYAKNLPPSAQVEICFTRITALPGTVAVYLSDLQPISQASRWPWQFTNLKWVGPNVNKGSFLRPNPTEFFVKPVAAIGKVKRDVVPGIWPGIYNRFFGLTKEQPNRWKKP